MFPLPAPPPQELDAIKYGAAREAAARDPALKDYELTMMAASRHVEGFAKEQREEVVKKKERYVKSTTGSYSPNVWAGRGAWLAGMCVCGGGVLVPATLSCLQ